MDTEQKQVEYCKKHDVDVLLLKGRMICPDANKGCYDWEKKKTCKHLTYKKFQIMVNEIKKSNQGH